MLTYYHPLDVVPGGVQPVIHVSQGDTNTRIAFELIARTGNFFLQSSTGVVVQGVSACICEWKPGVCHVDG